ncbi:J domain-containing protein, partial [Haematococcus lacustris]
MHFLIQGWVEVVVDVPLSQDVLLNTLSPEARGTAQATFGRRLERLTEPQELLDFLEVLESLREDMGVQFDLFDSDAANNSPREAA